MVSHEAKSADEKSHDRMSSSVEKWKVWSCMLALRAYAKAAYEGAR